MGATRYLPSFLQRLLINTDEGRPRTPFRVLLQVVLSLLLAVVPRNAYFAVFDLIANQLGVPFAPYASGLTGTYSITVLGLLYFGVTYLFAYGLSSAVVARYLDHRPVRRLFTRPESGRADARGLALGLLAGGLAGVALVGGLVALGLVSLHLQDSSPAGAMLRGVAILVASVLYGGSLVYMQVGFFMPNFTEGLRGYIGSRFALGVGVLACGLLFGFMITAGSGFLNLVGFAKYLLFSALLAGVYARTGRLSISIGIMAGWFSVVLATGVAGYQFQLSDGLLAASQADAPLLLGANYGLAGGLAGFAGNFLIVVVLLPLSRLASTRSEWVPALVSIATTSSTE